MSLKDDVRKAAEVFAKSAAKDFYVVKGRKKEGQGSWYYLVTKSKKPGLVNKQHATLYHDKKNAEWAMDDAYGEWPNGEFEIEKA